LVQELFLSEPAFEEVGYILGSELVDGESGFELLVCEDEINLILNIRKVCDFGLLDLDKEVLQLDRVHLRETEFIMDKERLLRLKPILMDL
jgi:hypothetical protein